MTRRFIPGQKLVCNTRSWWTLDGARDPGSDPEFNEIVTLEGYYTRTINGYHVVRIKEYPRTPYAENEFEEYIEDFKLEKLLCGRIV
jgi:hypothetical protein